MNCARARFLVYAYLDRELSCLEGEALARHLSHCRPCAARAVSARRLADLLHSRLGRAAAPQRLRARLNGSPSSWVVRPRYPVLATAAALLITLLPLVSDVGSHGSSITAAGLVGAPAEMRGPRPVSRRLTGTFVCLECEARSEAGLCPVAHAEHETGFCADNGELWRLMSVGRDPETAEASLGRTATVEGVAFPESGFLRVSRVGY